MKATGNRLKPCGYYGLLRCPMGPRTWEPSSYRKAPPAPSVLLPEATPCPFMSFSTCPLSPSPHSPLGHMAFLKPSHATHEPREGGLFSQAPVSTISSLSFGAILEVALRCGVLQIPSSSPFALSGFSALPSPVSSIPCIQYPLLKGAAGCRFPGLDLDCPVGPQ